MMLKASLCLMFSRVSVGRAAAGRKSPPGSLTKLPAQAYNQSEFAAFFTKYWALFQSTLSKSACIGIK